MFLKKPNSYAHKFMILCFPIAHNTIPLVKIFKNFEGWVGGFCRGGMLQSIKFADFCKFNPLKR